MAFASFVKFGGVYTKIRITVLTYFDVIFTNAIDVSAVYADDSS